MAALYFLSMKTVVDFSNYFIVVFLAGTLISFLINHILEFIDFRARVKNKGNVPLELKEIPLALEVFTDDKLKKICFRRKYK